jgi:hypothetical protein
MKSRPHDPALCDHMVIEVADWSWWVTPLASDDPGLECAIPEALECEPDTGPLGFTVIGPAQDPRPPAKR